ncbi:MAG: T9SS type A sorting domain-containing protein [Endomicrobium sp.]|jgi:hypothetical protein|nr:T9SS type A sorting domain-containing protein [Endomicrobium sp.]
MIKIYKLKLHSRFLLLLFLSFTVFATAEGVEGDISLSNGGQLNQNSSYQHMSSINNGITFPEIQTFNYTISAGVVTSFVFSNNNISFDNLTLNNAPLISGSTVPANTVSIGATVTTANGFIRDIGYAVSQDLSNMENFTVIYNNGNSEQTVTFSTTTDKLKKGVNYIQLCAHNTLDADGLKSGIFTVYVNNTDEYIKIIEPGPIASRNPKIRAALYSAYGVDELKVIVQIFPGKSTNTASIYYTTGQGHFDGQKFLCFTYDGRSLRDKEQYTLSVGFTDNKGNFVGPQLVTFSVDNDPIAQLLPYPSPYNPNSGKPMKIKYILAEAASVTINIYDRAGKFISKVTDKSSGTEGANYAQWNATSYAGDSLANGIYICEIITNNGKENRRYRSFAILKK